MSEDERAGMRGHENGNVRPADDRYGLHRPEDESQVCSEPTEELEAPKRRKRSES